MLEEALQSKKSNQSVDYMEKIEKEINRMLVVARKKQRERDRIKKQEDEDKQLSLDPKATELFSPEVLIANNSLSSLLKR